MRNPVVRRATAAGVDPLHRHREELLAARHQEAQRHRIAALPRMPLASHRPVEAGVDRGVDRQRQARASPAPVPAYTTLWPSPPRTPCR
ncbi:hypothetical protein [Solilutibacter oculi]|uniref:hypothetical protein n=1 Tax=Solilutibacter oculi TaxID=2698682 RepID=UPI001C2DE790|nr:hypothetical protein [Lysobacter oculi]